MSDQIYPKMQIKQTAVLLGALLAVTKLLLASIAARPASAAPSAYVSSNPLAQTGSGKNPTDPNADYIAQYLETKGYTVVNVGYLKDNNGIAYPDQAP